LRTRTAIAAAVAQLLFPTGAAHSTTFAEVEFECPVGGEKFTADVVVSNITFGQRPDGKPYSPLPVPPIVECPDNGLLLFEDEFSEEDLTILTAVVQSEEYQSMRTTETPHFRAFWLKGRLGRDRISQLGSLLQATWETDENYDRKVRYQARFVAEASGWQPGQEHRAAWFWYNMRAVNALRELGYFDKAAAHLSHVTLPENFPVDGEEARYGKLYADRIGALLKDRNPLVEPANLVPPDVAIFRCVVPQVPLTPAESHACSQAEIQTTIDEYEFKPKGSKKLRGESAVRAAAEEFRGKR